MSGPPPRVSVVVSTFNRASRLRRLLAALGSQTLSPAEFEVVVVDDGSSDETRRVLAGDAGRKLPLRTIRRARSGGPAAAREQGWRAARGELIAFTDDDCEPDSRWLETGIAAVGEHEDVFVQGRTEPNPKELSQRGPFTRTIEVTGLDHNFHTCNIFYPRPLLERIGGFDTEAFARAPGGEDSDLAWRAIAAGAEPRFAPECLVHHAVNQLGPLGKLRVAARWTTPMRAYARHPELRRATFVHGLFWKREHLWLARALLAALLPRRLLPLRLWLGYRYARNLWARGRVEGGGPMLAPYYLLHDLVEAGAVARAAIRYRTPML